MSQDGQEMSRGFLLPVPVSATKGTCLLEHVPAEQFFDGHAFKYNRNIWVESGRAINNNVRVWTSGKKDILAQGLESPK